MTKSARDPVYRRHRFPADVIAHAVWLYFRFPLSLDIASAHHHELRDISMQIWRDIARLQAV